MTNQYRYSRYNGIKSGAYLTTLTDDELIIYKRLHRKICETQKLRDPLQVVLLGTALTNLIKSWREGLTADHMKAHLYSCLKVLAELGITPKSEAYIKHLVMTPQIIRQSEIESKDSAEEALTKLLEKREKKDAD